MDLKHNEMQVERERLVNEVLTKIQEVDLSKIKVLLGFDGFIDEILHVVDKRINCQQYERLLTMSEFGKKIVNSSGLSMNIEMVAVEQKIGGNGTILANALANQGMDVTYIGALGERPIHPLYVLMGKRCKLISICEPAHTSAIEFLDGKIISSTLEAFNGITWKKIEDKVGKSTLKELISNANIIGFLNWTMVLSMTDIWRHLLTEILPLMDRNRLKEKILFVDLADPEKRDPSDIRQALWLLEELSAYFTVVLGLNQKEAGEIAELRGYKLKDIRQEDTGELTGYIRNNLNIDMVVVHSVKEACIATLNEVKQVEGFYCSHPKLSTGAGDNFNAGFILGCASGCSKEGSLLLGCASSGYYVKYGMSANLDQICDFMRVVD